MSSSSVNNLAKKKSIDESRLTFSPTLSRNDVRAIPTSELRANICGVLIEWPKGSNGRFLPKDDAKRVINIETISIDYGAHYLQSLSTNFNQGTPEVIVKEYSAIFGTLALCRAEAWFAELFVSGVNDSWLPLTFEGNQLFSKVNCYKPVPYPKTWDPQAIEDFERHQWTFLAPDFSLHEGYQHYDLLDHQILPIISERSQLQDKACFGGSGEVFAVQFHPAHSPRLDPGHKLVRVGVNPLFAVKKLYSRDRRLFDREVSMHNSFDPDDQHAHLTRLCATYHQNGFFYLIFPWANCDLRGYWKQTPRPEFSKFSANWMLHQLKGLASGLQRINGFHNTDEAKLSFANPNGLGMNGRSHTYRTHGDVKPENILWSGASASDKIAPLSEAGRLTIADYGLMQSFKTLTNQREDSTVAGATPAYTPPEFEAVLWKSKCSRKHDSWSLGCVFLEYSIWFLYGWEELCQFNIKRGDAFHSAAETRNIHGKPDRVLSSHVRARIARLHQEPRSSQFIHELLALIPKMLVIEPEDRLGASQVNVELSYMIRRAELDSEYLAQPCPWSGVDFQRIMCEDIHASYVPTPLLPSEGTLLPSRKHLAHVTRVMERVWKFASVARRGRHRDCGNAFGAANLRARVSW